MLLLCSICHQIPYIEFIEFSKILIICRCRKNIIHQNLIKLEIEQRFNLQCYNCYLNIESEKINVYQNNFYCDKCIENINNYEEKEYDFILKNCFKHGKEYKCYLKQFKYNVCENCDKFEKFNFENLKNSIPKIERFLNYEKSDFVNYNILFEKIINTFNYLNSKQIFNYNGIINYFNLNKFLEYFYLDNIVCKNCYNIYKINYIDKNIIKLSCKCHINISKNIKDFLIFIKTIECNNCHSNFLQKEIYLDFLSNKLLCKKCLNERFDFIKFNEIGFICNLHFQVFEYYCKICDKNLCQKCKYIHPHIANKIKFYPDFILLNGKTNLNNDDLNEMKNLLKLNYEKMKYYNTFQINIIQNYGNIFENYNNSWLNNKENNFKEETKKYYHQIIKLYKNGDFKANKIVNYMKNENEDKNFFLNLIDNDIYINVQKINKDFEEKKKNIKIEITQNIFLTLKEEILKDEDKMIKSDFKNYFYIYKLKQNIIIPGLASIRNYFIKIIDSLLKKYMKYFNPIKENLNLLFESYQEIQYRLKENKDNIKNIKMHEIILTKLKKFIIEIIQSDYLKNLIEKGKKENLFSKEEISQINAENNINDYFKVLSNILKNKNIKVVQKVINSKFKEFIEKEKAKVLKNLITKINLSNFTKESGIKYEKYCNDFIDNKMNENQNKYTKLNLFNENMYFDQISQIDILTEKNLLNGFLKNSDYYSNNFLQHIHIDNTQIKSFLEESKFKNEYQYYFYYYLMLFYIKTIGTIIHQNKEEYSYLFTSFEGIKNLMEKKKQLKMIMIINIQINFLIQRKKK